MHSDHFIRVLRNLPSLIVLAASTWLLILWLVPA